MPQNESLHDHGFLVIVTGPPASGKDTIVEGLLKQTSITLKKITTHTTRAKRPGEVHGVDYHFVKEEKFLQMVSTGEIVEHVKHGGSWKGTHKDHFIKILKGEENYIWRIDPSRSAFVYDFFKEKFGEEKGRRLYERTMIIYVDVDDHSILLKRWRKRENNADLKEFKRRYKQDLKVFEEHRSSFHHRLINDSLPEKAVNDALKLIRKHFNILD